LPPISAAIAETDFKFSRKLRKRGYDTTPGFPAGVSRVICTSRAGSFAGRDRNITALIRPNSAMQF
jgi:hypothetical protein